MDRMIGKAKTRLWWIAGIFCALLVSLAGCGQEEPPVPKYGVRCKPVTPARPKPPAAKPEAPAEKPSEPEKKG